MTILTIWLFYDQMKNTPSEGYRKNIFGWNGQNLTANTIWHHRKFSGPSLEPLCIFLQILQKLTCLRGFSHRNQKSFKIPSFLVEIVSSHEWVYGTISDYTIKYWPNLFNLEEGKSQTSQVHRLSRILEFDGVRPTTKMSKSIEFQIFKENSDVCLLGWVIIWKYFAHLTGNVF